MLISGAMDELRALAERAQIPVAMTLLGIGGMPASHPLNIGMMGMHGEAWVNHAIQEADLLIAAGMRFDDRVTGQSARHTRRTRRRFTSRSTRRRSTRTSPVDVALIGDLRDVLRRLMPSIAPGNRDAWLAHINGLKGDSAVRDIQSLPDDGHLYAAHVINDLWRATREHATRSSSPTSASTRCGKRSTTTTKRRDRSSPPADWARWGLPCRRRSARSARGPDAEVWAIVGDGGFQMTMCELATAVQEGIAVKVAIINNGYLGMVRQWQEFFYERRYAATPLSGPDFVKLAEAFGIRGIGGHEARRRAAGGRRRAQPRGPGGGRFPRRAGRYRLSDGAGRRRPARDDPPAQSDRRNRRGRVTRTP